MVLNPPSGLVDFFWLGHHWLRAAALFLPLHEGGQGLVDLESRVAAFRLQAAQRLLYITEVCCRGMARALLKMAGRLGLDLQLFLMTPEGWNLTGAGDLYASVLKAWCMLRFSRQEGLKLGSRLWEEPIFHNPLLHVELGRSATWRGCFVRAGITKMEDLCGATGRWKTPEELSIQTGMNSETFGDVSGGGAWEPSTSSKGLF